MHTFLLYPSRRFRQCFDSPGSSNSWLTQRHCILLSNTERTTTSPAQLSHLYIRQSMVMFPMFHRPQTSSSQVTSICRTHFSHGQCSSVQEMTRLCVRQRRRILLRVPSNRLKSHPWSFPPDKKNSTRFPRMPTPLLDCHVYGDSNNTYVVHILTQIDSSLFIYIVITLLRYYSTLCTYLACMPPPKFMCTYLKNTYLSSTRPASILNPIEAFLPSCHSLLDVIPSCHSLLHVLPSCPSFI